MVCALAKKKKKTRDFWASINKYLKSKKKSSQILTCEDFLTHFQDVFKDENVHNPANQNDYISDENESGYGETQGMTDLNDPDLDAEITLGEVKSVIKDLKTAKSPGIDDLAAEVFKSACDLPVSLFGFIV